jgi:shikimate dehydrogenase
VLALLGFSLGGNPTQYMVEKALEYHELDWRFLSLEVAPDDLADAVRGMRAMGFSGGTCARPHKQPILQFLDGVSETAEMIGAANCLLREDGRLVGENTEGKALLEAIRQRTDPAGKRVVLLGAGAVARSVGVELALAKAAEIVVVNRSEEPGRRLVELLEGRLEVPATLVLWDQEYEVPPETDLLVNATSIAAGNEDARLPMVLDEMPEEAIVADVTFNPPTTWLVRQAEERGLAVIDGLETLIVQQAINLKLWTGVDVDQNVMREAVEEFLEL